MEDNADFFIKAATLVVTLITMGLIPYLVSRNKTAETEAAKHAREHEELKSDMIVLKESHKNLKEDIGDIKIDVNQLKNERWRR